MSLEYLLELNGHFSYVRQVLPAGLSKNPKLNLISLAYIM